MTEVSAQSNVTQYVNPFIGSAAHGHVFVGANVPFGSVQLGPTNIFEGWDWCSGYNYASNNIIGFTHKHLSGTGIGDMNDILIMPGTGKAQLEKITKQDLVNGYGSTFSHEREVCKPGYYKVFLDKYNVHAELTATERVGFHQYKFDNPKDNPHFIIDLVEGIGWDRPVEAYLKQVDATTFVGYRFSAGWSADQREYFAIKTSIPVTSVLYDSVTVVKGKEVKAKKVRAIVSFKLATAGVIKLKVGLSPVSTENALLNIQEELPGWDMATVVKQADAKWNKELSRISIKASDEQKRIFYTALYHTMFAPSIFNDVNGDYRGTDKKVYPKATFTNYTTFSLWDTYRAFHPLYTIIHPGKVPDVVNTMLAIYQQQGKLPVWHLMGSETNTMLGYHAVPVIADAYLKGYRGFDVNLAYEAMKQSAMQQRLGINFVQRLQHIPADSMPESVALGLEYSIDDWCIAQVAKALDKKDDYEYFMKRSKLYASYFDRSTGFMRGKLANGQWREPFDPVASKHREDDYAEGNAWQYTWLVPHDVKGLIDLFGGTKPFTTKLDSLFIVKADLGEESSPDISGLIGLYAHGNEPGHHTTYLYAYAGQPWKTAEKIRTIADQFYTTKPDGLCGNEDVGQMSAWYVFSAIGFYPVNPANGLYVFGSPLIDEAILSTGAKPFRIEAVNNSKENKYIQRIELDGKPYEKLYLHHADVMAGGHLKIFMGSTPSSEWGRGEEGIPDEIGK